MTTLTQPSATVDRDTSRPRWIWDARFYQVGSHPAITEATGPFPSYSTVSGLYTNASALMAWAAKVNSQAYAAQFVDNGKFILGEHACEIVSDTGHYRRQRDEAAQRGTDMHGVFQELLGNVGDPATKSELSVEESKTVLALRDWIASRDYVQFGGEQIVADPRHKTAGRYDSWGTAAFKRSEKNVLVDLKTGKSVKPSSFLQVAGYWAAIERELPHLMLEKAIILHAPIGCESVNEIVISRKELREHYKAFLAVRELWNWHVKNGGLR